MTYRRLLTYGFSLAAMFAPGVLTAASADVAYIDEFKVTLGPTTSPIVTFDDTFSLNQTLAGGAPPGTPLPSGVNFSDGTTPGRYIVIGTLKETGNKGVLDTAQGALALGPGKNAIKLNSADLLTGAPTSPYSLTQNSTFTTTGLFDLTKPSAPEGFYQLELSTRVASNHGMGDVISVQVKNCAPGVPGCMGVTSPGYFVQLQDANFATGISHTIDQQPLDTNNQKILLELTKPDPSSNTVDASYEYFNNGTGSGPMSLGSYSGLFGSGPGQLGYAQAGFTQLAPLPEPSSLALLASSIPSVLGLVWVRRRRAARRNSGPVPS